MEIAGLPLHPLIVHAVVIFVPLSALGAIAISVSVWVRRRYGWLTSAFALIAAGSTLVAQAAGQALYASFQRPTPAMTAHMELGGGLLVWVVLLFAGALTVTVVQFQIDRERTGTGLRVARWVGLVVSVITAVAATVQVIRIGHSGSVAVWG
jgi:hypothetical protein